MTLGEQMKQHATTIAAVATVITVVFGWVFGIKDSIVWAGDFDNYKAGVERQLQQNTVETRASILTMERQHIEDKLYEIDFKRGTHSFTPQDEAMYARFRDRLRDITQKELANRLVPKAKED